MPLVRMRRASSSGPIVSGAGSGAGGTSRFDVVRMAWSAISRLRSVVGPLEAVFTTTIDCIVTGRALPPMSMFGMPNMGDSLGHPDLAPDCDGDRGLRPTPGGGSRPPAGRDGAGAEDLAALSA